MHVNCYSITQGTNFIAIAAVV